MKIGISYGVMADPISEQIDKYGLKYDRKTIERFEIEKEAVNNLRFGTGLLTDSMVDKILPKLHKAIIKHLCQKNKLNTKIQ